jgi:hypothetical protein
MGFENDDKPVNLIEGVRSEITEEEPIEQVFSQETDDISTVESSEPTVEAEDQERFEETAKFEESIDTPKVERKPDRDKVRKSKGTRKTRNKSEDKPISQLHSELRKHSDARKKTDLAILDIRKELKDLLLIHHATIKDLQKQVTQMHRKIAIIDSSKKSTKAKTTGKKTARNKKTSSSKKSKKKSGQKKSRKR